jgi:ABC-type uncharacterized transport system substrate-binding protein
MTTFRIILAALAGLLVAGGSALAHPHVWVVMKSEVVYAPDGTVVGVRQAWTFDDMFSTFATQGLAQKTKGVFTREELAPLAEVNVTSLKEFSYFTHGTMNGAKLAFVDPTEYWLSHKDGVLTLHFTLPLKTPDKAKTITVEVYDPSYFVDFAFAKENPVTLAGAPATCKLATAKLDDTKLTQSKPLSEAFFNNPASASNLGSLYANRITVNCP